MILVLLLLLCVRAPAQTPCWPLEMPSRYLTGNFMEPRDGRFHAGLDFKTASRTGFPVLAAQDGHVQRIRMSATGYGIAVYLAGADGKTYVYGHLERLRDDLREHVQARQRASGGYEVDLWFGPHDWPVQRCDVLALSGQSATLGPHLHFEVRGTDGRALDPLAHGFAVDDRIAPQILAVRAVRDGGVLPPSLRFGDGTAALGGRLPDLALAPGPLYFSALIIERSDRQNHRLGPWRVRLLVDGHEVYAAVNDSLHWDLAHHQVLEFRRTPLGLEQLLRVDDRNRLAGRRTAPWLSAGQWAPGAYDVQLVAEDRAGNATAVSWRVVIADEPPPPDATGWRSDGDVLRDAWLVAAEAPDAAAGRLPAAGLAWAAAPLRERVPPRFWRLSGLREVGLPIQYRLEQDWALLEAVRVVLPAAARPAGPVAGDPALGVYRLRRQAWTYVAPLTDAAGGAGFALRQPGVYQVLRDVSPPVIATAGVATQLERQPARQRGGITLPAWPVLKIPVGDPGSGIEWRSLATRLDGEPLIVEPDPPRDRVLVELPAQLPPGSYRLAIEVGDRAGHLARATLSLTLSDPAVPAATQTPDGKGVAVQEP